VSAGRLLTPRIPSHVTERDTGPDYGLRPTRVCGFKEALLANPQQNPARLPHPLSQPYRIRTPPQARMVALGGFDDDDGEDGAEVKAERPAALLLVDRTLDLLTPTLHPADSLAARFASLLPRRVRAPPRSTLHPPVQRCVCQANGSGATTLSAAKELKKRHGARRRWRINRLSFGKEPSHV
jgi:hypothetical protein